MLDIGLVGLPLPLLELGDGNVGLHSLCFPFQCLSGATWAAFFLFLLPVGFFISQRLLIISRSRKGISCLSWVLGLQFTFSSLL